MKKFPVLLLMSVCFASAPAAAASKYISSPGVKEDVTSLKNRGTFDWDGGDNDNSAWHNKVDLEHGLTQHFKVGIAAEVRKLEGDSLDYSGTDLKATYLMTGPDSSLQAAIQGAYKFDHTGSADEIEAKLLLAGSAYGLDHKANIALGHEVGDDSDGGVLAAVAWGSYYDLGNGMDIGGEYYGDFGNLSDNNGFSRQEHHIGPVVGFSFPIGQRTIGTRLGYLVGFSKAASDNVIKYELQTDF